MTAQTETTTTAKTVRKPRAPRATTKTPPPIAATGKTDAGYAAEVAARMPAGKVRTGNPQADRAVRDAAASKDAGVLSGLVPPEGSPQAAEDKAAHPEPKPRPARKPRATKPAPAEANGKTPVKAPANGTANAESNGSGTVNAARESNQELARRLVDLVAKEFRTANPADQQKLANWLKILPTGGAGYQRYWPESLTRPSTADWRPPAN